MTSKAETRAPETASNEAYKNGSMQLDVESIKRGARENLDDGANTPSSDDHREAVIKLLNGALATELLCVLRYKRHYFTATGLESPAIADEFLVHAEEESGHADKIARRIVQLGGEPDFHPSRIAQNSHADYDESLDLHQMVKANLIAERIAVESYRQMVQMIGEKDPTTRRMLEEVLADEEEHADELSDWMKRI